MATEPIISEGRELRRGWTTGTCATAATKAAFSALCGMGFPDPVTVALPRGGTASLTLADARLLDRSAMAAVIKDAGDDPDVTHGCRIEALVQRGPAGSGVEFRAGEGVGMVTRPGLPIPPGEPAVNPGPRRMMLNALEEVAAASGEPADLVVTISIPGGEAIAAKTWNPRLGIVGGLSILGTTGIVVPFSCSAWIHSIHRGIDVARAAGLTHVAASTGSTSEAAVQAHYRLPDFALLDMGDFVGGTLKYLRAHPVPRLTLAGGFAKLTKLAQGAMDLHSSRNPMRPDALGNLLSELAAPEELVAKAGTANTALELLQEADRCQFPLAGHVAARARAVAQESVGEDVAVEVRVYDRSGKEIGWARGWS
ncbi:MAG TPA: cobalt-precorrin-5B (C(1))-methyltransferase [Geminicoccus sp.]|uniref:cobalt-precorrin-5B (C(1))-methyltransferase n=1 Tax=Geminicoccus sp. TaxID=2024832 RepID=UPI002E35ADD0|nr:cobalt-precorrin-5B (C(1))-methyltransferase [Geminicoccus sp.]HEX2525705.1 cobalt-precorrin-5B (C(1))-methyltransferase [Geminicoccus sp.]